MTIVIRLNSAAMNEFILSDILNCRECYETENEWQEYKDKIQNLIHWHSLLFHLQFNWVNLLCPSLEFSLCAPCSTQFHLAEPGGLAEHSLNVFHTASTINTVFRADIPLDSLIISCLLPYRPLCIRMAYCSSSVSWINWLAIATLRTSWSTGSSVLFFSYGFVPDRLPLFRIFSEYSGFPNCPHLPRSCSRQLMIRLSRGISAVWPL